MFIQARWNEPLIFKLGDKNRQGITFETDKNISRIIPKKNIREKLNLPNLTELEVARHYTRLTQMSFGIDNGPVPLGSCTMKYNPRLAEKLLYDSLIKEQHPITLKNGLAQGSLEVLYELQEWLKKITGMYKCSLQPPAGASGELSGVLIIKKYFKEKGEERNEILIPDSAHGSNPASARMGGFNVTRIPSNDEGLVDLDALKESIEKNTAGLMLTNPNTLGLFEKNITYISDVLHKNGSLLYYDGANLNGIIGVARPGDMGFDLVHLNLHKTFSAPHGGGGPGAGVICSNKKLSDYLPGYIVEKEKGKYNLVKPGKSIGEVSSGYANIPGIIYAYTFILSYGNEIWKVAVHATYNTNYFLSLTKNIKGLELPYSKNMPRLHEAVLSMKQLARETGVTVNDVSKALLDKGLHAPTIYFPLIVDEAFMIEFTETEPVETIEKYAEELKEIMQKAYDNPSEVKKMPNYTSRKRLNGIKANHPSTITPSVVYEWRRKKENQS